MQLPIGVLARLALAHQRAEFGEREAVCVGVDLVRFVHRVAGHRRAVRWCVERLLPRHRPCKVCNYTLSHTQVGSGPEASETAVLPHTPRAPRQEVKGGRSPTHPIDRFVHQFYLKTSFETRNVQKLPELQLSVRSGYVRQARSSGRAFTSPHASFHSAWNHVTLPSRCPRRPHRRRQARLGAHRGPRRWRP